MAGVVVGVRAAPPATLLLPGVDAAPGVVVAVVAAVLVAVEVGWLTLWGRRRRARWRQGWGEAARPTVQEREEQQSNRQCR